MSKLWLDLELREDIDDYVTLIYAMDNYDVSVVSIHNPSINELTLLKNTLINSNIPIVITGEVVDSYPDGKDLNPYFINNNLLSKNEYNLVFLFDDFVNTFDISGFTVFCGGSLKTLSLLTNKFDVSTFKACVQGGFASYKIVEPNNVLKKFRKRESVPTWNLNLDLESTKLVLKSGLNVNFVSKNICHSSFVSLNDVKNSTNNTCLFLTDYFNKNTRFKDKCLHDLLALMSIFNDFVEFKNVKLLYTKDERPKWWSEIKENSNHKISVSYDYKKYLSLILK